MMDRVADRRTEDVIVFDLLRVARGSGPETAEVVGQAVFRAGDVTVTAPDAVRIAVEELLARAFVDRVQSDERPRGYRRSGRGMVDLLVPGMPEHFLARLRGLWLPYPDGAVVTARLATEPGTALAVSDAADAAPPVTDATTRRSTLGSAEHLLGASPLTRTHPPETGVRPASALARRGVGPVGRSDCGWLV